MIIEKACKDNVDVIFEINQEFSDGWSQNQMVSAFNSGRFNVLIAKEGLDSLGYISYSVAIDECDIETIVVKKQFRRKGVGEQLIKTAEKEMLTAGIKKVFLEVRENNFPALTLYKKCGYSDISVRKNYYPDGENAVVMAKELL